MLLVLTIVFRGDRLGLSDVGCLRIDHQGIVVWCRGVLFHDYLLILLGIVLLHVLPSDIFDPLADLPDFGLMRGRVGGRDLDVLDLLLSFLYHRIACAILLRGGAALLVFGMLGINILRSTVSLGMVDGVGDAWWSRHRDRSKQGVWRSKSSRCTK